MNRYVVAGNPVEHSQSPFIHARFAQQTGQSIDYDRLLCPLNEFAATVRRFAAEGGQGCNVTVPFKLDACSLATHLSERAALAQAANVLRFDEAGWFADNTDGVGLVRDIEVHAGRSIQGRRLLLIGAGGAAAGALAALLHSRPGELVLANRSLDKAQHMVGRHAALAAACGTRLTAATLDGCGTAFDIVVNASASSLNGGAIPVPAAALARDGLALDMMYGAAAVPFMSWARQHGAEARDGIGMLVEQAAESFFIWRGVRPETAPVLAALRARLAAGAAH